MGKQQIMIYGVNFISNEIHPKVCQKYLPVCFIRENDTVSEEIFHDLPVYSVETALEKYPQHQILLAVSHFDKHKVIEHLLDQGVSTEQIIGFHGPVEERWGCAYLGEYAAFWHGELRHCCSLSSTYQIPNKSFYQPSGAETYHSFISDTQTLIQNIQNDEFRQKYCGDCQLLRYGKWLSGEYLDKVNIGIESPCNYRCIYCATEKGPYGGVPLDDGSSIESALQTLRYCKEEGRLDDFSYFFISCGEPSIHPRIEEITELVGDYRCTFAINASIYSEQIATVLKKGMSTLRVSIDAGTPETYAKVRGVSADFYEKVHDNLKKYAEIGKQYVELQYILIPGENVDDENIEGFCSFAQDVCKSVLITRDRIHQQEIDVQTARAYAKLRRKLEATGIRVRVFAEAVLAFSQEERDRMDFYAHEVGGDTSAK